MNKANNIYFYRGDIIATVDCNVRQLVYVSDIIFNVDTLKIIKHRYEIVNDIEDTKHIKLLIHALKNNQISNIILAPGGTSARDYGGAMGQGIIFNDNAITISSENYTNSDIVNLLRTFYEVESGV